MTPLARLKAIHARLEYLKESPDILVNYLVLDMLTNLLPSSIARRALNTHGVTLVASNLPGECVLLSLLPVSASFTPSPEYLFPPDNRGRKPHVGR